MLFLVRLPSRADLVVEGSNLARDLIGCPGSAVDATQIAFKLERERGRDELGCICARFVQDKVRRVEDLAKEV